MKEVKTFISREFVLLMLYLIFLINPNFRGFYFCFIIAFYFISIKLDYFISSIDFRGLLLIFFSITYAFINSMKGNETNLFNIMYAVTPISLYVLGKYFGESFPSYKVYYFLFLLTSLGFIFIPTVSIIDHIINQGFVSERNLSLIWQDKWAITATALGAYYTLSMGMVSTIFIKRSFDYEKRIKYIFLISFVVSLLCVLRVASRTQLALTLISFIVIIFYLFYTKNFQKAFFILIISTIVVFTFIKISTNSVYFIVLNERNNDTESLLSAGGRTELWTTSLNNIITKPFGWKDPRLSYSHNLWLDVDRSTGIFPLLFLLFFTVSCFRLISKALKVAPDKIFFNSTILVIFISSIAVFFVEPIIEGMFMLFLIFCFIIGIISSYSKINKDLEPEEEIVEDENLIL